MQHHLALSLRYISTIALLVVLTTTTHEALAGSPATTQAAVEKTPAGYVMATTPREWSFPRDHGRHDGFKTEWWYFAGNVADSGGRKFGYQLAFFRVSVSPLALPRESPISLGDYYFAHAAVSDLEGRPGKATTQPATDKVGQFYFKDRIEPEKAGIAIAAADTLDVQLRDWSAKFSPATTPPSDGKIAINAGDAAFQIRLTCDQRDRSNELLTPVLQGPGGVNRKGVEHGAASYYYSIPRLPTAGTLTINGEKFQVVGNTWMDHEFSSNALGTKQVGWDWVGLQLADGRDLMVYRIRNKAGGSEYLSGTLIDNAGHPRYLAADELTFTPATATTMPTTWKSVNGAVYPQVWVLSVRGMPPLILRSRMRNQELRTDATTKIDYFEGSCEAASSEGKIVGEGYLEMTGYAKPLSPF